MRFSQLQRSKTSKGYLWWCSNSRTKLRFLDAYGKFFRDNPNSRRDIDNWLHPGLWTVDQPCNFISGSLRIRRRSHWHFRGHIISAEGGPSHSSGPCRHAWSVGLPWSAIYTSPQTHRWSHWHLWIHIFSPKSSSSHSRAPGPCKNA